jgi:putative hydrolase of the HAD superfamily
MIKGIIFDCFGVLIHVGFHEMYRRAGGDPQKDNDFINDILAKTNSGNITTQDAQNLIIKKIKITEKKWQETIQKTQYPSEDVLDWVRILKKDFKLAILSNAGKGTLQQKFTKEQLELFDTIVVSAEVGVMKPDAKIYQITASNLNLEPGECLFTDDMAEYCKSAEAVGMKAIQFKNLDQFKQDSHELIANSNN